MHSWFLALGVVAMTTACSAELTGNGGGGQIDASARTDAPVGSIDGPLPADAGVDARPCMGGDAAGTAPDGSCLVHVFAPVNYADARTACTAMGAHLAVLRDSTLDTFAESFIGARDTWIGLADTAVEGTFVWDDGSGLTFTNWHTGEPNDGDDTYDEDCGIIAGARVNKQWDDRPCAPLPQFPGSGVYAYLCQY